MRFNRVLFIILSVLSMITLLVSCDGKGGDPDTSANYYRYTGGQIVEVSNIYVDEDCFLDSNVQIVVPTPDDRLCFEYPLYKYNNKNFDLTKADPVYADPDYTGWGYAVYGEQDNFYWAERPYAQSGSVLCRVSRGLNFSAIVKGKFKTDGVEVDIDLDLPGLDAKPAYQGKIVDTKPETNYVSVQADEVYIDRLHAYYVADESEKRATVFVKIDKSFVVFDYDLEDYNGVEYDLSKLDTKALDDQEPYLVAYASSLDYKAAYDKYLYLGTNTDVKSFSGTCRPTLTVEGPGKATFAVELHAKLSFGRTVDLVYKGPAEQFGTRPLPEPCSHGKINRIMNAE